MYIYIYLCVGNVENVYASRASKASPDRNLWKQSSPDAMAITAKVKLRMGPVSENFPTAAENSLSKSFIALAPKS